MNKSNRTLFLVAAAIVAVFTMNTNVRGATPVSHAEGATNRALAASPRYLEEHPELLHPPLSVEESKAKTSRAGKQLTKLLENRALARSPRFLEEHPELLRIAPAVFETQARTVRIKKQLDKLMENRAWANSPRVREEFPELINTENARRKGCQAN